MKISIVQLRKIIKEEIEHYLFIESDDNKKVALGSDEYQHALDDIDHEEENELKDTMDSVTQLAYDDLHLWATGGKAGAEMNNEMKTLMGGWRRFVNEGSDPHDPKNPELRLPKGPNSASLDEEDLEEGHQDPDEPNPNREGDGDGGERWDTP
jgi:hypothetical protein